MAARPLRVWLVDPGAQVPDYDRALAAALVGGGCTVELWTAPSIRPPDGDLDPAVTERLAFGRLVRRSGAAMGVGRARLGRRGLRAATYLFELAAMVSGAVRCPPDVLHLQWSLAPPVDGLALRLLRRRGVTTVFTAHNVLPHEAKPWQPALWAQLHRSPDRVVAHSLASAQRLEGLSGVAPDRIRVVPMPAPRPARVWSRGAARAWLLPSLGAEADVVLFVGQVRPYKGLDLLVAAMSRVRRVAPGAHLVVAGEVPGGERGAALLRARLDAAGPAGWFTLRAGHRPRDEVEALLAAADVVALPYRATDDSAVLGAALGSGRAVVATAVGGLPEALDGAGLLVAPGDPGAIAEALIRVIAESALRSELEARADAVADGRTWRRTAERTRDIYIEAARRTPRLRVGR